MDDFYKQNTFPDLQPIPEKIGPYKIESLLNKGGMSLLYLGIHPTTGEPLAIKVLLPKFVTNKEITNRFLKEAQIIGMTNHPNIAKLYGEGQWEKGLYIAMEFIRGVSLRQFIQQKSLSHRRALEIVLQVAYALCHLHTHGVIHRDLKPENIIMTETGEIKVIDFGIAQLHGEAEERPKMMGTPVYMSPEQKQNPNSVTYASDIYSLGIIAYELVLGRLSHGVIHLTLLPPPLRKIIEKALKPNPKERYHDIVDFITDISQYLKTYNDGREEEEIPEGMLDMLQHARTILIPKKIHWPEIDIGIASHEGTSGLYLDFFRLSDQRLCIVLGRPFESGVDSLLHSSNLRGMVRMAVQLHFINGKKNHPIQMLHSLNQLLSTDPMKQTFAFSLLLLTPEKDQLSFISCKSSNLWHIPDGSKNVRTLATPNPALGADPAATLLETADNWNPGDTLILQNGEDAPEKAIEHLLLSPQPMAEKILHQMKGSIALVIQRIF